MFFNEILIKSIEVTMDQIYLFAGLYGFFGSILIVLFKILPDVLDWRTKKEISEAINPADWDEVFKNRKFLHDSDEKTLKESQKTYDFYSTLWSFRLIGTGFMITIIYALFPSNFLGSVHNSVFVIFDVSILLIVSTIGIENIRSRIFTPKSPIVLIFIFGIYVIFYFVVLVLNASRIESTRLFFVDNVLIISGIISQILFTSIFFFRYYIEKYKSF